MTCEGYYKSSQEVFAEVGFQTASKVFITPPLRAPGQATGPLWSHTAAACSPGTGPGHPLSSLSSLIRPCLWPLQGGKSVSHYGP